MAKENKSESKIYREQSEAKRTEKMENKRDQQEKNLNKKKNEEQESVTNTGVAPDEDPDVNPGTDADAATG